MITTSCHDYNKQLIEKGYVLEKVVGLIDTCEDKKMKKICLTIVTNICKE